MSLDVKTAIQTGDGAALCALLAEAPARANELIRWGENCRIATHPLHYVSDMLFDGTLARGKELALVEELLAAGAEVDYQRPGGETALIGASSLGAEDVGLRLLDAGADPARRGKFGETALHWAAMLGEHRLAARLIARSDVNLKDDRYHSTPLGWARHGSQNPPAGNQGHQQEVIRLLIASGAVELSG